MSDINVIKRNGETEKFNIDKINRVLNWATDNLTNISASDIAVHTKLQLTDNIRTSDIHQVLIDSAADLVTIDNPNYTIAASRLLNYQLRKDVWGGKNPPKLYDLITKNVDKKIYTSDLLSSYTEEEIHKIDEWIDHDRDFMFDYGGLIQMMTKYLIQSRHTNEIYETPQFSFMLIGMICFAKEPEKLKWVKRFYDASSKFKINIPTPILAGARTNIKSYSSCCLINIDDTKRSLMAAAQTTALVTCDKYGIGLNLGRLRPLNSSINGGETLHAGVISWLRIYQDIVHACQQGGARRGAGTVTFPIFHPEIMTILELKNNQGTHENRVPHLDYCIGMSNLFYKRMISKEKISLFSSKDAPELYDVWGTDKFDETYLRFERSDVPRIEVNSLGDDFKSCLFNKFFKERLETGRIYAINVDQANLYSPWKDPVTTTNLCVEVLHPLKSETMSNDPDAEIGVCILGATNMLNIKSDSEHKKICELLVRLLDNIIDMQTYSVPACERFATRKRSLGIGVTNLAAWLASKGYNHMSDESPQLFSDYMEKQQYYLMSASNKLAQERGTAPDWERSKYYNAECSPLDLYNKGVDSFLDPKPKMDWAELMESIKVHGLRNMTLSCIMPCQSSSIVQNSTNGIEPITSLITYKTSKTKTTPILAPSVSKWKNKYTIKNQINDNKPLIRLTAAGIKWLDMAASGNLYYNNSFYEDGVIPISELIYDHLLATKYGWKTFYYCNSEKRKDNLDNLTEERIEEKALNSMLNKQEDDGCSGGSCTL